MTQTNDLPPQQTNTSQNDSDGEGILSLHRQLRKMILDGVFPPGAMLSQVKLAESLGVSRIPLREALRMLQNEGLIAAEHNQRARVPPFEPSVVDSLYASRILLETLAVRLTIPHLNPSAVQALNTTLNELDRVAMNNKLGLDDWEVPHRRFHALLVHAAEDSLCQRIASLADRCEYYRRLYYRLVNDNQPTRSAQAIAAEHYDIANACIQGKVDQATHLLARHYARTVLIVLGQMTPEFDPVGVRTALQIVGATITPPKK